VQQAQRLDQFRLVDLARHHDLAHARPLEQADYAAHPPDPGPVEFGNEARQVRAGEVA
jgi:hypothetical protein